MQEFKHFPLFPLLQPLCLSFFLSLFLLSPAFSTCSLSLSLFLTTSVQSLFIQLCCLIFQVAPEASGVDGDAYPAICPPLVALGLSHEREPKSPPTHPPPSSNPQPESLHQTPLTSALSVCAHSEGCLFTLNCHGSARPKTTAPEKCVSCASNEHKGCRLDF